MPAPTAVRMTGICKAFDGVTVLDDVDFEVEAAEVHALAGGNGAGKSTLMKILQGVYQRDAGRVELFGEPMSATTIQAARAAGIGMVFQEFSLISTLTVAQNIFLDDEPTRAGLIDDATMRTRSAELLARIGVEIDPAAEVGDLSTAQWQLTEIAKALRQDARVLIMDEPTASLAKHEVDALFELIARLKAQGIAVIYISHRMDEIYRIADRITILRNGRHLLTARLDEVTPQEIVAGIAGKELVEAGVRGPRAEVAEGPPLLEVQDVRAPGVDGATFEVRAGEVVGIAGLMGAGRTELARALFGVTRITGGGLRMHGAPVSLDSPADAIAAGIALIPEDRRLQGLVLDHSVRENLTLPVLDGMRRWGLLVADRIRATSDQLIERFHIAVARPDAPARLLSGGNQQKIVIAKWLGTDPEVLVMDEPTAGVDVGTKSEIVRIVRELARTGKGIVVISSEYPELIAMCDRFLIMRAGRIVDSVDADSIRTEVDLELAVQGLAA
ncbi:MAG: sugar ABC transporter ATP-binding protein [Actinomycetales bacterium]|nr:sugar ABC transporter ATP-binding protein [Actinomycetales bacterium]